MLVPRSRFGSSLYNVPLLLALRFFYHASPFEAATQPVGHPRIERDISRFTPQEVSLSFTPPASDAYHQSPTLSQPPLPQPSSHPSKPHTKLSTHDWLALLSTTPATPTSQRLISLTWTKALASPLSHEFIQFIIEDPLTNHRSRHLTHRHVDGGDTVLLNHSPSSPSSPSSHHRLPLPLLSLTFPATRAPSTAAFAALLVSITARKPAYSLLREMCWWHAEAVFEGAHAKWGGRVREWEFAHLRYSFVVRTDFIRREKLVSCAERWRERCAREMVY
jgi:hypothetical protein